MTAASHPPRDRITVRTPHPTSSVSTDADARHVPCPALSEAASSRTRGCTLCSRTCSTDALSHAMHESVDCPDGLFMDRASCARSFRGLCDEKPTTGRTSRRDFGGAHTAQGKLYTCVGLVVVCMASTTQPISGHGCICQSYAYVRRERMNELKRGGVYLLLRSGASPIVSQTSSMYSSRWRNEITCLYALHR